uniref:Uncharacterized protein n=1 Tax=Panagrolaimus sp. PS1159 TaxID=55785 RepID=A0AC35GVG3_9BILA
MRDLNIYQCCSRGKNYCVFLIDRVQRLDEILRSFEEFNLEKFKFAIFKNGVVPIQECLLNRYRLTHCGNGVEIDYVRFLKKCWYKRVFDLEEVNGVYITNKKVSVWLNEKCYNVKALEGYTKKFITVKHEPDISTLNRTWTFGFFDFRLFKFMGKADGRDRFIDTDSEEQLGRSIYNFYHLYDDKNGIFLSSNILNEKEWRIPNANNRFVYSRIKVNLEIANKILLKFALSLVLTFFPEFSNIYLAFCFYQDGNLEIGIYLSGKEKLNINSIYSSDEGAVLVGHKLKQIYLENCNPEINAQVKITNAIPSNDLNFCDPLCEYRTNLTI